MIRRNLFNIKISYYMKILIERNFEELLLAVRGGDCQCNNGLSGEAALYPRLSYLQPHLDLEKS